MSLLEIAVNWFEDGELDVGAFGLMASSKVRHHKGLTTAFRQLLQMSGVSVDEELAHRILSGANIAVGLPQESVDVLRRRVLGGDGTTTPLDLMKSWEQEHPGERPFPAPFPERILDLIRDARRVLEEDGNPAPYLDRIATLCRAELGNDPYLPDFDDDY